MSEISSTAILIAAGNGSRLGRDMESTEELVRSEEGLFFADGDQAGQRYEKPGTTIVQGSANYLNDEGIDIVGTAVGDLLALPEVKTIRFLTNPDSRLAARYQGSINRREYMARLGRTAVVSDNASEVVTLEYMSQPRQTSDFNYYGTGFAIHFALDGGNGFGIEPQLEPIRQQDDERVIVTESDEILYDRKGNSILSLLADGIRANRRGAQSSMVVTGVPEDIASQHGLAQAELDHGEYYLTNFTEAVARQAAARSLVGNTANFKNTTRYAIGPLLRQCIREIMESETRDDDSSEFQVTDALVRHIHKYTEPLLVVVAPKAFRLIDLGNGKGLNDARQTLHGLDINTYQEPAWDLAKAVQKR